MQSNAPEIGVSEVEKAHPPSGNGYSIRGTGASMLALEHVIADISPIDIPVLLVGESGCGKEVVAMQIHQLSRHRDEPFHKISCATVTPDFLDRLGQGYTSGPKVENGSAPGSVFLDEVCGLDFTCQSKLLNFLPDGDGPKEHCLGQRVISATNRNPEEEMSAGRFREELYYRINGVCLRLPPLRQRKEDIPALVDFFLKKYAAVFGYPERSLTSQSLRIIMDHHWPGNIRELENTIKKLVALGDERAALAELSFAVPEARAFNGASQVLSLKETARAASHVAERELILKVLARTRWNRKRAAKELQISYKALLYKLKQIGMDESAGALSPRGERG
jgi:two-component system response regulator AtoC